MKILQILLNRLLAQVGPLGKQVRGPPVPAGPVHDIGVFGPMSHRLAEYCGSYTLGSSFKKRAREAAADAVSHVGEFADDQVIHHPELVVGEATPGIVNSYWPSALAAQATRVSG